MHKLLSLIIVTFLSIPYTAGAVERDKKQHFWYSGAIATAAYVGFRQNGQSRKVSYMAGVSTAMFVGLLKELTDSKIDKKDLEYDLLGAVSVPLLVVSF